MECAIEDNGLILNSHFVPPEILTHILHFIDPNDLIYNCRFVCKNWNEIIINGDVWKRKIIASNFRSFSKFSDSERKRLKLPWHVLYRICSKDPFEKNLLLNNCGQNELQHWYHPPSNNNNELQLWHNPPNYNNETKSMFVLQEESRPYLLHDDDAQCWRRCYRTTDGRGGRCVIEPHPIGADPLPECDDFEGHKSCFVTSHQTCIKEQTIDLSKNGFSGFILDVIQPKIVASEWFTGRFDCGFQYKLTVTLISSDGESVIQRKETERRSLEPSLDPWEKVSLEFENYGPGVRFVAFNHHGRDSKTWAGYYGTKMAGGVVKVILPNLTDSIIQR